MAVTGIGVVAPGAVGLDAFAERLGGGLTSIGPIERFDTSHLRSHRAALLSGFNPRDFIPVMKMRRMNQLSRVGVAAMRLALENASISRLQSPGERVGVAMGTSFGPVETSVEYMKQYVTQGAALAPPQLFAESVANAPGSHIAIEHGLEGFNVTFTQRESSALAALMFASGQVLKGTVTSAVAGGVEEINDMIYSVLDRIGALARDQGEIDEACRPFDRRRNGIVVGEGGALFLLQREAVSAETVHGFVSGFGVAKDPTASISDWGRDPGSVARAMRRAVHDAGIEVSEIDAVWASGNSSVKGDRLEAHALQEVFGERCPPVVASKGYFGEYAAAGGLQIASALVAMRQQVLPESVGFERGEAGAELPLTRTRQETSIGHILVNSLSAGGGVISAVLSRTADD